LLQIYTAEPEPHHISPLVPEPHHISPLVPEPHHKVNIWNFAIIFQGKESELKPDHFACPQPEPEQNEHYETPQHRFLDKLFPSGFWTP
jgi:hypothetical protein